MTDANEWLNAARLPERTVPICLRGDLVAEHEELERQLGRARDQVGGRLTDGAEARRLAGQIDALEEQMREASKTFRLRALGRRQWLALVGEHPARKDDNGGLLERDNIGVNSDTFFDALIRACMIDPQLDDDQYQRLGDALTDRQFNDLADASWSLNRREVDIPKSRAASRLLQSSAAE